MIRELGQTETPHNDPPLCTRSLDIQNEVCNKICWCGLIQRLVLLYLPSFMFIVCDLGVGGAHSTPTLPSLLLAAATTAINAMSNSGDKQLCSDLILLSKYKILLRTEDISLCVKVPNESYTELLNLCSKLVRKCY